MSRKQKFPLCPSVLLKNNFTLEVFLDELSKEKLLLEESLQADFFKKTDDIASIELKLDVISRYASVGENYQLYLTKDQLSSEKQSYFLVNSLFEDKRTNMGNPLEVYILSNK